MGDLIDRDATIKAICEKECDALKPCQAECESIWAVKEMPSIQPTHSTPSNALEALDCVSREDLTKEIEAYFGDLPIKVHYDMLALAQKLPSVQPAPCEFCKHNDVAADGICLRCMAERRGE